MRTEVFKRGVVSILLVFALAFSTISVVQFASSGKLISTPTEVSVVQGQTFVLSQRLVWDEVEDGDYIVTIYWEAIDNKPSENFTFVEVSAYFDLDNDNLPDPELDPIEASVTFMETVSPYTGNLLYTLGVRTTVSDERNGEFNVDITLSASGVGGVPHVVGDHLIEYSMIVVSEARMLTFYPDPVTVHVLPKLISVSPSYQSGLPGTLLTYNVTITNTGSAEDTYTLSVEDNAGWTLDIPITVGPLSPKASENVTLSVAIPDNALPCTEDTVIVTATSEENAEISDNASCIAHATVIRAVDVSISPSENAGLPGENVTFTVTVKNIGSENDNFDLTVSDNTGWGPALSENLLENVQQGKSRTVALSVIIPSDAPYCTRDNVTVRATSQADNTVSAENNCIAHATAVRWVDVSISPSWQSNLRGENLTYRVTVKNVGVESSSYNLEVIDSENWNPMLDDNLFENIPSGGNRTTTLRVTIPNDATPCTEDKIIVKAISLENAEVSDNANCIAHSALILHSVSITPSYQAGEPSKTFTYTVTVTNKGTIPDNYDLEVTDHALPSWEPTLDNHLFENVPVGGRRTTTLRVTISATAPIGTIDKICVVATSQADSTVRDNASCVAHSAVVAVEVSITPENQSGEANYNIRFRIDPTDYSDLEYTVTVTNKGTIKDTYTLTISDNAGWGLSFSDDMIEVSMGESKTTTLYVEIPYGSAPLCTSNITVTATSQIDNTVSDNTSCIARVAIVDFEITISPGYQRILLGKDLVYTLTVINTGTGALPKLHSWSVSDDVNWELSPENGEIAVSAGKSTNAYFTVRVLDNATHCTRDNLTVKAEAFSPHIPAKWVTKKASAIAHATTLKHEVIILIPPPKLKKGRPGDNVTIPLVVRNLGLENDTYDLTVVDDALPSWKWRFDDNPLENVQAENSRTTKLWVTIPDNVPQGMNDNLMVIATSRRDPAISESDNCIVLVENFTRGVEVSIKPSENSALPGENLTFIVTVKNLGTAVDNFELIASDNLGWSPSLSLSAIRLPGGASGNVALTVRIPENTENCTCDNIWVIARSLIDNTVENSASCTAHAMENVIRGVEVSISPPEDSAEPGRTLTFTVTVTNTGNVLDNYILSVSDDAGWGATLAQNLLTIPAGESRTTTVSVTVPSDAVENESTEITVVATSQAAPTVSESASCIATAKLVPEGIPLAVPLAISVFLIGAAIIVPTYLLRVRPRKEVRPTLFRERRRGLGAAISGMADLLRGRRKKARRKVLSFSE